LELKVKLWLEKDGEVLFGLGRLDLLKAIAETGSLASAARRLNMSYRAAWGRLKASEERLGFALLDRAGGRRQGQTLTPRAKQIMAAYERIQAHFEHFLDKAGQELAVKLETPDKTGSRL
jgi:molybdate transport system regulatory protein